MPWAPLWRGGGGGVKCSTYLLGFLWLALLLLMLHVAAGVGHDAALDGVVVCWSWVGWRSSRPDDVRAAYLTRVRMGRDLFRNALWS